MRQLFLAVPPRLARPRLGVVEQAALARQQILHRADALAPLAALFGAGAVGLGHRLGVAQRVQLPLQLGQLLGRLLGATLPGRLKRPFGHALQVASGQPARLRVHRRAQRLLVPELLGQRLHVLADGLLQRL